MRAIYYDMMVRRASRDWVFMALAPCNRCGTALVRQDRKCHGSSSGIAGAAPLVRQHPKCHEPSKLDPCLSILPSHTHTSQRPKEAPHVIQDSKYISLDTPTYKKLQMHGSCFDNYSSSQDNTTSTS